MMRPCRKRVLTAFGAILVAVLLFVPYRSVRVVEVRQPGSNLITRTTTKGRGFLVLPRFLAAVSRNGVPEGDRTETTGLNAVLYAGEIAAVLVLGVLDYFLLCPKVQTRRPGQGF
jgi:hypothetical protein